MPMELFFRRQNEISSKFGDRASMTKLPRTYHIPRCAVIRNLHLRREIHIEILELPPRRPDANELECSSALLY